MGAGGREFESRCPDQSIEISVRCLSLRGVDAAADITLWPQLSELNAIMLTLRKGFLGWVANKHRCAEGRLLQIPDKAELQQNLIELSEKSDVIARCLDALKTGTFKHPDGRTDELGPVRLALQSAGLLAHLARHCKKPLSVEVGFGMGSSTATILATRTIVGSSFEHIVFDPYGLGGRGKVVEEYLAKQFKRSFRRIKEPSEIGLGQLIKDRGRNSAGLLFIDGGHRFENVLMDFVLADHLCCEGGYIVLDDALFPAIETVVNYVKSNRTDYAVSHLIVDNTTLLQKIAQDQRGWDAFEPFEVPNRRNWERFVPQA